MAPSKLRKAIGAVKDQTSIGLAKVGGSATLAELDVAIVKATRHQEYPAEEKHIREILSLTCYSRSYISACVSTISRRLSKTKNWVVALKALMLVHRLLTHGDSAYEQEIFFATRRGTRLLNMSDFCDTSRSNSWDYSAFVRTYALYQDELLEFRMQGRRGKHSAFEDEEETASAPPRGTPVRDMKIEHVFSRIQHLMQLLERFLACKPTGSAKHNRVVLVALYPMVKESFQIYQDMTETMGTLIHRFRDLEVPDSAKTYDIFCRLAKQFDELNAFYVWCKNMGIARLSEFPDVDQITARKLEAMDEFIREKSALMRNRKVKCLEAVNSEPVKEEEPQEAIEEDMNAIKALPAPEDEREEKKEETAGKDNNAPQQEADLLDMGGTTPTTREEHGDRLALALFDGGAAAATTGAPAWEAFNESGDWETALVQSASHLSNQKASLPGGFDMLVLDSMYQHGAMTAAMASPGYKGSGSASSVVFGYSGRPAMLALPAPPPPEGGTALTMSTDPFAASLVVAPPAYVQMSEMEKKQRLLVEEQMLWQQYGRHGMQGELGMANLQQPNNHPYPYSMGGYMRSF